MITRGFGLTLVAARWVSLSSSGQRSWRLHRRHHGHQGLHHRVFLPASSTSWSLSSAGSLRLHRLRRDLGWLQRRSRRLSGSLSERPRPGQFWLRAGAKKVRPSFSALRRLGRNRATRGGGTGARRGRPLGPPRIFSILAERKPGACGGFAGLGVTHH